MSLYTKLCLVLAGQGQGSRDSISLRLNRPCDIIWMSQDCVPEMQKHFTGLTQAQGPGRILYNKIRVKDK